jgi:hypothetical protein
MKLKSSLQDENGAIEAGLKENITTLNAIESLLNGKRS